MKVFLTERLKQAIALQDIAAARSAILTEVRNDRTRDEPLALRLADIVSKELPGLYEPDNGVCSGQDDMAVSDETWLKARSAMMLNFSRERLCFIEKVVRGLGVKRTNGSSPSAMGPRTKSLKTGAKKCVFLLVCLIVGIILTCVAFLLKDPSTGASAQKQLMAGSKWQPHENLCVTNNLSAGSTNASCTVNFGKDNQ